jgi:hypothetical protein
VVDTLLAEGEEVRLWQVQEDPEEVVQVEQLLNQEHLQHILLVVVVVGPETVL